MVGIVGAVKVLQVAAHAIRSRGGKIIISVACRALQPGVRAGEREPGKFQVVELRSQPAIDRMALLAVRGVSNGRVVGVAGPGVVAGMAGVTRRGETDELAARRAFVAGFTGERGVRSDQRKTVLVLLYVLDGHLPAFDGMARLALRSHLAAMDIGMAVSAFLSNVSEYQLYVTLRARDLGVHPAQRIGRLVVIEIRYCANGLPVDAGMARLAGQVERPVGAPRGGAVLRSLLPGKSKR